MSKAIPKLRFKEFKGEWINKKFGEVVSNKSGKYNPAKDEGLTKCIELEHLSSETGQLLGFANAKELASMKNTFRKGDVLFGKLRPYLKKFLLAPFDGVCSSEIWVLTGNGISNNFLYQIVQRNFFVDLANLSSGSKMPRADWDVVSSGLVIFPTLPEQQKIASFLSAVDEKIQQLTRKKELLEQYKKGVMQQLFCLHYDSSDSGDGHDGLSNHGNQKNHSKSQFRQLRFKDENGKAYPKWEEKRLGDVLKIGSGRDYKHLSIGDVPVYGTGGLMTMVNEFLHDGETVCIGRKGTIDKPMFYNGKIWTVDTLFFTFGFKNSIPKFIYFLFQQINWKLYNEASGVPSLSKATIEKLKFDFPFKEEQQKIANFISAIDTKIEGVATQIEKTQTFKKGLLQQMFV